MTATHIDVEDVPGVAVARARGFSRSRFGKGS